VAEFISAILYHFNHGGRVSSTPQILNKRKGKFNSFHQNTNDQNSLEL
jgi:hypothetical protein